MKTKTKVYAIAAVFYLLPKKWRHRFFSHFHGELREHFSKPMERRGDAEQLNGEPMLCLTLLTFGKDGFVSAEVYFAELRLLLRFHWRHSNERKRFSLRNCDEVVYSLTEIVKSLDKDERRLLWTILDDAIVDYEDYLIANDPRWLERLNRARREKGRSLEKVRLKLLGRVLK